MQPFIPRRFEHIVFGLLLSGLMSFLVSGLSTVIARGVDASLPSVWLAAWLPSWMLAFPAVLVVAPYERRILRHIVRES